MEISSDSSEAGQEWVGEVAGPKSLSEWKVSEISEYFGRKNTDV